MGSAACAPPGASPRAAAMTPSESPIHDRLFMRFLLRLAMGLVAPALSPANRRRPCSRHCADLLLAQRPPDVRAQMHEALQVHHILDALVLVPSLGGAHAADVEDFLDAARPPRHHCHAVSEIYRLLHR